jgi:hypothetical protein
MKRLYLTVEGQTEQVFSVQVLGPHLTAFNVYVWKPRLTGPHGRRGGRVPQGGLLHTFRHALEDMRRWLKEDESHEARFSMMVDLYGLPHDFPGYEHAVAIRDPHARARLLEESLAHELADKRFIPYLQVHEFEALVLSDPGKCGELCDCDENDLKTLIAECQAYETPEHINDNEASHPKARIHQYMPEYDENVDGPFLTEAISLASLRAACPHFGQWLGILESLDG